MHHLKSDYLEIRWLEIVMDKCSAGCDYSARLSGFAKYTGKPEGGERINWKYERESRRGYLSLALVFRRFNLFSLLPLSLFFSFSLPLRNLFVRLSETDCPSRMRIVNCVYLYSRKGCSARKRGMMNPSHERPGASAFATRAIRLALSIPRLKRETYMLRNVRRGRRVLWSLGVIFTCLFPLCISLRFLSRATDRSINFSLSFYPLFPRPLPASLSLSLLFFHLLVSSFYLSARN